MQALLYFLVAVIGVVLLLAAFALPIWQKIKDGSLDDVDLSAMTGSFDFGSHGIVQSQAIQFPLHDLDDHDEPQEKRA